MALFIKQAEEEEIRLRNLVQHKRHCELVKLVPDEDFSKEFGVKRLSILDEVPDFDVCKCLHYACYLGGCFTN